MNCKIVLSELDDFLDAELKPMQHAQVQSHLSECDSCHQAWQQELEFRQLLKEHTVPAPALGLEERAFAKIPKQAEKTNKNAFVAGFSGAIAAGVVLMIAAALFFNPAVQTPVANITLALHQSKKVKMVFDVPEAVAEATFSMRLPEHVEIAGSRGLHQIEWKTALKKGKNLLSLPIVANAVEAGELIAEIKYADQIKTFRMKLDIKPTEQGMLEIIMPGVA